MRKFIVDQLAGALVKQDKKNLRPHDRRGQHSDKGGRQHAGLLLQRHACEATTGDQGNPEEERAIRQAAINAAKNPERAAKISKTLTYQASQRSATCNIIKHGRCGFFPAVLRLRPKSGQVPLEFEVAEILHLQTIREQARSKR